MFWGGVFKIKRFNYFKILIIILIIFFILVTVSNKDDAKDLTKSESKITNINLLDNNNPYNFEENSKSIKKLKLPETFEYKPFIDNSAKYDFKDVDATLLSAYNVIGIGYGESVQTLQIKNTIDKHTYNLVISYPSDSEFKILELSNYSIEYKEVDIPTDFYDKVSNLKQEVIPPQDYLHKTYEITIDNNTILGITAIISHDNINKKRWYLNLIGSSGGTSLLYQTGDFSVYDMNSNVWWRRIKINTNIVANTVLRIPHKIDEVTDDNNITKLHPALLINSTGTLFIGERWKGNYRLKRYNQTHFEWQPDFNLNVNDEFRVGIGLQYHFYQNTTSNSSITSVDLSRSNFPIYLNWTGGYNNITNRGSISCYQQATCTKYDGMQQCIDDPQAQTGAYTRFYTTADESWYRLVNQIACSVVMSGQSSPYMDYYGSSSSTIPTWSGCSIWVSSSGPASETNYGGETYFIKDTATTFTGTCDTYARVTQTQGTQYEGTTTSTANAGSFEERGSFYASDINLTINGNGSYFNESGDLTWDEFKTSSNLQNAFNTGINNIIVGQSEGYGGEVAFYFNYQEEIPVASNIGVNKTNPVTNENILHYANWVDDSLASYIFSSNYSGTWSNDTWVEMTGTNNWSNYSKAVASSPGTYGWRIFANDTDGNWGDTGIQYIQVNPGQNWPPIIDFVNITPLLPTTKDILDCGFRIIDQNFYDILTANITWFKNNQPWNEDNEYMSVTNNAINHTSEIGDIESYKTSNGDIWICSVNAFDGYEWSGWKNSTSVTIYNDLQVNDLSIIHQINTQRIFRFEILNQLNYTINVSWKFETGISTINSLYNTTLEEDEDIFVYLHYNYTSPGNYLVKATAYGDGLTDSESINITI